MLEMNARSLQQKLETERELKQRLLEEVREPPGRKSQCACVSVCMCVSVCACMYVTLCVCEREYVWRCVLHACVCVALCACVHSVQKPEEHVGGFVYCCAPCCLETSPLTEGEAPQSD